MFDINFENSELQILVHHQFQRLIPEIIQGLNSYNLKNHFVLLSSGTTGGEIKGYALSREALFTNAQATNEHFNLTHEDVWGLSLPLYHVGGLSVLARAHLLKNKVIDLRKWNPESWIEQIKNVSMTTIVPTQLYDLVKLKYKAPLGLRYLVVGGDFLSSELKARAMDLDWPVIRTFGMSEVCSQLASTMTPQSDDLHVLPIHKVKTSPDGRLLVKSESLFTLRFSIGHQFKVTMADSLCDHDGYFETSDFAVISGQSLKHLGRMGDEFKIAGHLVNIKALKEGVAKLLLAKDLFGKVEFIVESDERKGKKLVLLILKEAGENFDQDEFSTLLSPIRVDEFRFVENLERTALGKFKVKG